MVTLNVLRTDYPMEVHSANCKCRAMANHSTDWKISGETVSDAVAKETAELNRQFANDRDYEVSELFRVMPCAIPIRLLTLSFLTYSLLYRG